MNAPKRVPKIERFVAKRRVDQGDGAWSYFGHFDGEPALLKVFRRSGVVSGLLEEATVGAMRHLGIPRLFIASEWMGQYYLVRQWIPGETFAELADAPPSRENTDRLCRAIYYLAGLVEDLHSNVRLGVPRAHNAICGKNVVVRPDGDVALLNFDYSHAAKVPTYKEFDFCGVALVEHDSESAIRTDLDALHLLFKDVWRPMLSPVVPLGSVVPRPIADLRDETFESAKSFRAELEIALQISGLL